MEEFGEIVLSEHGYDVGLCVVRDYNGDPTVIYGRYSPYGISQYGFAKGTKWINTGRYTSLDDWKAKTNQHQSPQDVGNIFGFNVYSLCANNTRKPTGVVIKSNWSADDVIAAAAANGVSLSEAEAEDWLIKHKNAFLSRMSELGNEVLDTMVFNTLKEGNS